MLKLYLKQLRERFIAALEGFSDFEMSEGNPFRLKIADRNFIVFVKSLSPGYFKGSPDVSRIQLPMLRLADGDRRSTFIALGYDENNNSFVAWNPEKLEKRLNVRGNVSLYSRISIQKLPQPEDFNVGILNSGERFLAFHSSLLPVFFKKYQELFKEEVPFFVPFVEKNSIQKQAILTKVTDPSVLSEIMPMLRETRILDTAAKCFDHYSALYPAMSFSDWLAIAKNMHAQLISDQN
ncbi:hypothetical protein [Mucilaginibacter myungsuensis]|uniref:Methylase-associated X1 domain-containing protein n=1 Tax=Mucilaginibacter myungsuensis TaxID=649104 RepID=A0A929L000_9SPHI|nr:hypothetical protein [Mucilaginibacter myungsuensis]MBE9663083.1 hypothetical protein [Mucilaginibacter myungsuensis]MDN3598718.1 hypothetical protein [Mucilaginibacter myungsuensis]